jgi:hypothetical protein
MGELRNSRDLIACYMLLEHLGYDVAYNIVPSLNSETIENIIKKEEGFDFSELRQCFYSNGDDVKVEYLKLADKDHFLAKTSPYALKKRALESCASYQRVKESIEVFVNLAINCSATP